jgi:hypothetical protein
MEASPALCYPGCWLPLGFLCCQENCSCLPNKHMHKRLRGTRGAGSTAGMRCSSWALACLVHQCEAVEGSHHAALAAARPA